MCFVLYPATRIKKNGSVWETGRQEDNNYPSCKKCLEKMPWGGEIQEAKRDSLEVLAGAELLERNRIEIDGKGIFKLMILFTKFKLLTAYCEFS